MKKILLVLVLFLNFSLALCADTVSYLGPEGTYTQEACQVFFGKEGTFIPFRTVDDAVQALSEKKSNYAVIPQENTIGGAVIDYVDIVIAQQNVFVVGEVELPITQNLLALPGTKLGDIKEIYSHRQGITQGKEWVSKNIPGARMIEVSSTAAGAKMVAEKKNKTCAAISSAACADVYGLEVLAPGIQNNDSNKTRFYVLSHRKPSPDSGKRLAFVASGKAEDLPELMDRMQKKDLALIAIHDRPRKTVLGEYNYLIECSGKFKDYQKVAEKSPFEFRYLGSFDVR